MVSMSLILSFDPFCYLMILLFRGSSEQQHLREENASTIDTQEMVHGMNVVRRTPSLEAGSNITLRTSHMILRSNDQLLVVRVHGGRNWIAP